MIYKPTMCLRWINREYSSTLIGGGAVVTVEKVLQQAWIREDGHIDWRDIKFVDIKGE